MQTDRAAVASRKTVGLGLLRKRQGKMAAKTQKYALTSRLRRQKLRTLLGSYRAILSVVFWVRKTLGKSPSNKKAFAFFLAQVKSNQPYLQSG